MANPFGFLKKVPWRKVGTVALGAAQILPAGSAVGAAVRVFKGVRAIDDVPISGAEKKADVLEKVSAATPDIALALSQMIDAYVALRKAWAAVKAAMAQWKQGGAL